MDSFAELIDALVRDPVNNASSIMEEWLLTVATQEPGGEALAPILAKLSRGLASELHRRDALAPAVEDATHYSDDPDHAAAYDGPAPVEWGMEDLLGHGQESIGVFPGSGEVTRWLNGEICEPVSPEEASRIAARWLAAAREAKVNELKEQS